MSRRSNPTKANEGGKPAQRYYSQYARETRDISAKLRRTKINYRKDLRPVTKTRTYTQQQLARSPLYALFNEHPPKDDELEAAARGRRRTAEGAHRDIAAHNAEGQEVLLKNLPYFGDKFSTRGDYSEGLTYMSRFLNSTEHLKHLAPLRAKYGRNHELGQLPSSIAADGYNSRSPQAGGGGAAGSGLATTWAAGGRGGGGGFGSRPGTAPQYFTSRNPREMMTSTSKEFDDRVEELYCRSVPRTPLSKVRR